MRHSKAWYAPADPGVYRMTAADYGTSGFRAVRTAASQARAYCDPTRTTPTNHAVLKGAR